MKTKDIVTETLAEMQGETELSVLVEKLMTKKALKDQNPKAVWRKHIRDQATIIKKDGKKYIVKTTPSVVTPPVVTPPVITEIPK